MATKRKRSAESSAAPRGTRKLAKSSSRASKAAQDQLAEEDARIAKLEKKLGVKKGKQPAPGDSKLDGLDDLLGDLQEEESEEQLGGRQQKSEYDEWLAQKRGHSQPGLERKGRRIQSEDADGQPGESDFDSDGSGYGGSGGLGEEDDDNSDASFEGFDDDGFGGDSDGGDLDGSEDDDPAPPKRVRENPYVAPPTDPSMVAKYVPPSLRRAGGSDNDTGLRRQLQGLLNRLTESNLQGILKDIEKVYASNPRGQVTTLLIEAIMVQVSNPATLSDTFFVLHAGFVAALYKVIGESFGSSMVTRIVEDFRHGYASAREFLASKENQAIPKATSNLITFLTELYVFQVVGCNLIFDFIRLLLDELSELNTELLLRIVRMAGKLLRKDDSQALKDVAASLQSSVAACDPEQVTERTRFMVDTITDLKNNKLRAGMHESAIVTEHVTTLKKFLGTLGTRRSTTSGPLRIGLKDIDESQIKGKWWLVGASFAGNNTKIPGDSEPSKDEVLDGDSSSDEDLDLFFPDYIRVAKEQGLKTDAQYSIFAAVAGASDHNDAYIRIQKLSLNKNQRREVAFVVIQAAGAEQPYNPYYALVAKKMCGDGRIRFAFQDRLWYLFRRLGESVFEEEGDEAEEEDTVGLDEDRLANIGRLMGSLVASSSLSIKALKCLDLPSMKKKTSRLVEQMMTTIFRDCRKRDKGGNERLERIFKEATSSPVLAAGLHFFLGKLGKRAGKSKRIKKGDVATIKDGCKHARFVLETGMAGAVEG